MKEEIKNMRVKESRMSMTHKSVFLELITQDSLVVYMTVMYSLLWCFMYAAELRNNMTVGLLWYSRRKRILHSFHYNLPLLLFGQKQPKWQLISVPNGSWQIKHVTEFAIFFYEHLGVDISRYLWGHILMFLLFFYKLC